MSLSIIWQSLSHLSKLLLNPKAFLSAQWTQHLHMWHIGSTQVSLLLCLVGLKRHNCFIFKANI